MKPAFKQVVFYRLAPFFREKNTKFALLIYILLHKNILYIIFFFITVIIPTNKAIAQKTDTIVHINGNVMKGEIKKIVYGVVTWKMDGMGTISFEEVKVNTMISKKQFEIKMHSGKIFFASFGASKEHRKVYLLIGDQKKLVNLEEIIEAYPIRKSFWMRTTGNFSLGLNFSKGSDVATLVFSGNLDYRKQKGHYILNWDSNNTYQGDSLSSNKADVSLTWERLFKNEWSTFVTVSATQNSELGTKLRLGLDLVGAKDLIYNDWNRLYAGAGLNITQETPYDDSGVTEDLAGIITLNWKVYKYTTPKFWVDANISFLPYITDNRYRASFNLNPQVSIFSDDFKIGFKFYYNYDSKPPTENASNDDYGLNLQFTYSLH